MPLVTTPCRYGAHYIAAWTPLRPSPETLGHMPRRKRRSSSVPPGDIYLTIHLNPPTTDDLVFMKSIHDAMQQTFGLTRALTHFDVAWKDTEGTKIVIRVGEE